MPIILAIKTSSYQPSASVLKRSINAPGFLCLGDCATHGVGPDSYFANVKQLCGRFRAIDGIHQLMVFGTADAITGGECKQGGTALFGELLEEPA